MLKYLALTITLALAANADASKPAVVIHCLEGKCEAGFAGEDVGGPRAVLSYMGSLKIAGDPIKNGFVTNADDLKKILHHIFYYKLNVKPEDQPVFFTESPLLSNADQWNDSREKITEIMFGHFKVPAFYIMNGAALSVYAANRLTGRATTGLVVDLNYNTARVVPVYAGYALPQSTLPSDLVGQDVVNYLETMLNEEGHYFSTAHQKMIVREVYKEFCYVALDFEAALKESHTEQTYEVSEGGKKITINKESFRAPEAWFQPARLLKTKSRGIDEVAWETIIGLDFQGDADLRNVLYNNIVLSGVFTKAPGFADRFLQELRKRAPKEAIVKLAPVQDCKRSCSSAWKGGAYFSNIMQQQQLYQEMWITKQEYEAEGVQIVHSKCGQF